MSEERDQEVPSQEEEERGREAGGPGSQEVPQPHPLQQREQENILADQQALHPAGDQQYTDTQQHHPQPPPLAGSPSLPLYPDFDINSIFNIENIPGLSVSDM